MTQNPYYSVNIFRFFLPRPLIGNALISLTWPPKRYFLLSEFFLWKGKKTLDS
jgi:hypothetical protein